MWYSHYNLHVFQHIWIYFIFQQAGGTTTTMATNVVTCGKFFTAMRLAVANTPMITLYSQMLTAEVCGFAIAMTKIKLSCKHVRIINGIPYNRLLENFYMDVIWFIKQTACHTGVNCASLAAGYYTSPSDPCSGSYYYCDGVTSSCYPQVVFNDCVNSQNKTISRERKHSYSLDMPVWTRLWRDQWILWLEQFRSCLLMWVSVLSVF